MGLRDTTLFAIACIVATRWVRAASAGLAYRRAWG